MAVFNYRGCGQVMMSHLSSSEDRKSAGGGKKERKKRKDPPVAPLAFLPAPRQLTSASSPCPLRGGEGERKEKEGGGGGKKKKPS